MSVLLLSVGVFKRLNLGVLPSRGVLLKGELAQRDNLRSVNFGDVDDALSYFMREFQELLVDVRLLLACLDLLHAVLGMLVLFVSVELLVTDSTDDQWHSPFSLIPK